MHALYAQYTRITIAYFFFQAEDGIRYHCVTGVQTCALPIYNTVSLLVNLGRVYFDTSIISRPIELFILQVLLC
mgnify:CR=1 FL=1